MITFSKFGNYGRLGNQMFQYATLKSISLRKNYSLLLPVNENNRLCNDFKVRSHYYYDYQQISNEIKNSFREKQFNFDAEIFKISDGTDLEGYFQSEKYFKEIKYILKREFSPRNENITTAAKNIINSIRNENQGKEIVAFHVRRGDNVPADKDFAEKDGAVYLKNKQDFHPLLTKEYIDKAPKEFTNSVFIIFSDNQKDLQWCKENIKLDRVYYIGGNSDLLDFECMKYCDHNIISNSSFSWWAAWLNENENKKIVAPSVWFGKAYSNHNLVDLIPENWKVI